MDYSVQCSSKSPCVWNCISDADNTVVINHPLTNVSCVITGMVTNLRHNNHVIIMEKVHCATFKKEFIKPTVWNRGCETENN